MSAFQSTLPRGERPTGSITTSPGSVFQSTLPRGERRGRYSHPAVRTRISIHAPAWGATSLCIIFYILTLISIHAPAWGATPPLISPTRAPATFQSTLPRGERRGGSQTKSQGGTISIHAPAWGATNVPGALSSNRGISIHAPAWGATKPDVGPDLEEYISIHAPAWGATIC